MKSFGRSRIESGLPPSELWGVSSGPRAPRVRSEAARARRRAKKAAKKAGLTLKAYLRKSAS
jgi:hypothetical protein